MNAKTKDKWVNRGIVALFLVPPLVAVLFGVWIGLATIFGIIAAITKVYNRSTS